MTNLHHVHSSVSRLPSLEDMHRMRMEGRDNEAILPAVELDKTTWQPDFPRREKPECP